MLRKVVVQLYLQYFRGFFLQHGHMKLQRFFFKIEMAYINLIKKSKLSPECNRERLCISLMKFK